IVSAMHYDVLEAAVIAIAAEHGAESARQTQTVIGRYVAQPKRRHRLIEANPLGGARIDRGKHAPAAEAGQPRRARRGPPAAAHEQVVSPLLSLDPAEGVEKPARGRWTREHKVRKRRSTIDLTLLQAGTGLRIGEALQVMCTGVDVD